MITGEELAAYAVGEADPALVARIETALPGDPELATRLERIREVDAELAAWSMPALPAGATDRLMAAVDAELASLAGGEEVPTASAEAPHDEGPTTSTTPDGVRDRPGAVAPAPSTASRVRRWLAGLVDGMGAPQLAGAAAALVVVVGVGAVLGGGMSGDDNAEMSADAGQAFETLENDAGGTASRGTETAAAEAGPTEEMTAAESEAMSEPAMTEAGGDEGAAADGAGPGTPAVVVIDDGRVVGEVGDIDATALRDRLEPLVDRQSGAPASNTPRVAGPSTTGSPQPLADGRVEDRDVEAVTTCLGDLGPVVVAEVVMLAPERDAVLYVQRDRVVVVGLDDCTRLGVVRG